MTKREKISILKAMRKIISDMAYNKGFCHAYHMISGKFFRLEELLNELGLFKPKKYFDSNYWYRPGNSKIRLKKIDQAITRLQKP